MKNRVVRVLSVAVAAACVTCADQTVSDHGRVGFARIPLAPLFVLAPPGGPRIDVKHVRGVLLGGTDSSVADALVDGDSAILEFENVVVHGDSSKFVLGVQAFDKNDVVVFKGEENLQVKPGDNAPANPTLNYTAPDSAVTTIDILAAGTSVSTLAMDWAGADTANHSCLNRALKTPRTTQQALTVAGKNAANAAVANVRVGWTSRDTTAFSVDSAGLVKSRCSNKSAYLVARTFLDKADSILVTVTAPAFSLLMSPDSTSIQRGSTQQLTALVVDENNNTLPAASVTWNSSDTTRAKVNATGLVTAVSNGRVIITAGSGGRTTVGVVQVVRPNASKVVVQPTVAPDMGLGQSVAFFAKALDAANRVIPDATGFVWSTNLSSVLTVNSATGVFTAAGTGTAFVKVTLDTKRDSVSQNVLTSLPPGSIKSKITNAADGTPLSGVDVRSSLTNFMPTAADGSFTLGGLQNGDSVVLSKTGFVTTVAYNVPAFPNKVLEVPSAPLSPSGGGNGTITGKVVNALSGSVVSGITVRAYKGINAGPSAKRPAVTPDFTVTTDATGTFTISSAPAGNYTLLFGATGYSDTFGGANSVSAVTKTISDVLVAPTAVGTGIYIVLTWGDCTQPNVPCDLDAHLTGPKIAPDTGRFQVFHANKSYVSAPDTIAALDVDDSNSRGPEIIGLRPSAGLGLYHFYVHNFSGAAAPTSKALADSAQARVDVYQDNHLIGTFFPPSGQAGTLWSVFDYDGARLIPVVGPGTISNPPDPAVLAIRAADKPKLPIRK